LGPGTVTGLHELRSRAIVQATHSLGIPTLDRTARRLLAVLDGRDLTIAVAAFLEQTGDAVEILGMSEIAEPAVATSLLSVPEVQQAVSERLSAAPDSALLGAALYGLRIA